MQTTNPTSRRCNRSAYIENSSLQQAAQIAPRIAAVRELHTMRRRAHDKREARARTWCIVLLVLLPTLLWLGAGY